MGRIAVSTMTVLVLLLAGATSSKARTYRSVAAQCPPAHSHVLLADAQAQIYTVREVVNTYYERVRVHGCAYGHRHPYLLGEVKTCEGGGGGGGAGCGGITLEALGGPMVAYEEFSGSDSGTISVVLVRDLRTGRVLHKVPTGTRGKPSPAHVGVGRASAIVVNNDGSVAWIAENEELSAGAITYCEVHAVDQSGSRVLASGTNIGPESLALAGSTLYWTQGSQPTSAYLN